MWIKFCFLSYDSTVYRLNRPSPVTSGHIRRRRQAPCFKCILLHFWKQGQIPSWESTDVTSYKNIFNFFDKWYPLPVKLEMIELGHFFIYKSKLLLELLQLSIRGYTPCILKESINLLIKIYVSISMSYDVVTFFLLRFLRKATHFLFLK